MNPFAIALNRHTLRLCALGAAVTLGGGCRQRGQHHGMLAPHRNPLSSTLSIAATNSGYCETRWIPLAPTLGSAGYIEHYVGDVETRALLVRQGLHSLSYIDSGVAASQTDARAIDMSNGLLINVPSEVFVDKRSAAPVNDAAALEEIEIVADSVDDSQ